MGRQPLPHEILSRRGSRWAPAADEIEKLPDVVRAAPPMPEWLHEDCRPCWTWLTDTLEKMGVIATADQHLMAMYCETWLRLREAEDWMRAQSITDPHGVQWLGQIVGVREKVPVTDDKGNVLRDEDGRIMYQFKVVRFVQAPQAKLAATLKEQLLKYLIHFGLTPSARSKVRKSWDQKPPGERSKLPFQIVKPA